MSIEREDKNPVFQQVSLFQIQQFELFQYLGGKC
jgi:hypothetical protein